MRFLPYSVLSSLIATVGMIIAGSEAIAQTNHSPNQNPTHTLSYDTETGTVQLDRNAFDFRTGELQNDSNIPLPARLLQSTYEAQEQLIKPGSWAPNTVELSPDLDYINRTFNELLNNNNTETPYEFDPEQLQLTTQFNVEQQENAHAYGEGIEVTVYAENGNLISRQSTFVRGDRIEIGPDGQTLPTASRITVSYNANDTVELRVLNLRRNGGKPSESGIYFSQNGEFVVEDKQNGGDLDFNDGNYLQVSNGSGNAITLEDQESISVITEVSEVPLEPEIRIEERVETIVSENLIEADETTIEEIIWGEVKTPETQTAARVLGHAMGARTATGQQLVYDRYTGGSQFRAGSDGVSFTGQLRPLANNPNLSPTLLSASVGFNPFVGDNEAGVTATLGATQFFNPTHRLARDMFGNEITTPDATGVPLVEPAGFFTNRQLVGYVPPQPDETVLGEQLFSTNGVFELPTEQSVVISPADSNTTGRGNSAYTRNVGGVIIEKSDGALSFVPQWTQAGHEQDSITLAAGEAVRAIYALVPQQTDQNLQLGETYEVINSEDGYTLTEGGYFVISADQRPENFAEETPNVYAVEDTLAGSNATTGEFNGIRGLYAQEAGGERMPTVDVLVATEADARVSNDLFPIDIVTGDPGQLAYGKTTRAAGLYVGGFVTGGIGNQRDTVTETTISMDRAVRELITERTVSTYVTPLMAVETVTRQRTETTPTRREASFDINELGELTNVSLFEETGEMRVSDSVVSRDRTTLKGGEELISTETFTTVEEISSDMAERDEETTERSDSYANFSAIQGELALGGVLNLGNTPWSEAANTLRAELFFRDAIIGRSSQGSETGWRAEAIFHPFGEVQAAAYQYGVEGEAIALYETQPVVDEDGRQVIEMLSGENGETVNVAVNEFVLDEAGDRIAQTVGTGEAKGPGIYLRVEDAFSDSEGLVVSGGLQFSL